MNTIDCFRIRFEGVTSSYRSWWRTLRARHLDTNTCQGRLHQEITTHDPSRAIDMCWWWGQIIRNIRYLYHYYHNTIYVLFCNNNALSSMVGDLWSLSLSLKRDISTNPAQPHQKITSLSLRLVSATRRDTCIPQNRKPFSSMLDATSTDHAQPRPKTIVQSQSYPIDMSVKLWELWRRYWYEVLRAYLMIM